MKERSSSSETSRSSATAWYRDDPATTVTRLDPARFADEVHRHVIEVAVRSSGLSASRSAGVEPTLEGALCLGGRAAGKKASHANVFVEIGPVDAFAAPDQAPVHTLRGRAMGKTRVPGQGHADGSAVDEIDDQSLFRDRHALGKRRPQVTR